MQDRLKFRVWHKKRKKMYEVLHLHTATWSNGGDWVTAKGFNIITRQDMHIQIEPKDGIIMQCTGLKDKKGQLIYEGDIVQFKISGNLTKAVVSYDNDYGEYRKGNFASLGSYQNSTEVIGNIYENEDLLNAT